MSGSAHLEKRSSLSSQGSGSGRRSSNAADEKAITDEADELAKRYRSYVEKHHGPLEEYEPVSFSTRMTDGLVYVVKIRIGSHRYVNLGVKLEVDGERKHGSSQEVIFCNESAN